METLELARQKELLKRGRVQGRVDNVRETIIVPDEKDPSKSLWSSRPVNPCI